MAVTGCKACHHGCQEYLSSTQQLQKPGLGQWRALKDFEWHHLQCSGQLLQRSLTWLILLLTMTSVTWGWFPVYALALMAKYF